MNKSEKIICLLLGAILAWYIYSESGKRSSSQAETQAETLSVEQQDGNDGASSPSADRQEAARVAQQADAKPAGNETPSLPAEVVKTLENELVKVEVSSWGAVVKKVTLKKYARNCGVVNEENPPVELDYSASPMGAGETIEAFEVRNVESNEVVFARAGKTRKIQIEDGYRILFNDIGFGKEAVSVGLMKMGDSKNDSLSVDSWAVDAGKGKPGVIHHGDDDSPLKPYLVGGLAGGCSGSKSAAGMPELEQVKYPGLQEWVAIKNRFFVTAVKGSVANGFEATIARDTKSANYKPESVAVKAQFDEVNGDGSRALMFYAGPKKQELLWSLGMKDVMEFGMWRWLCYPLVWVLNLFNTWIPNYGVAIILLTILVRILFWPLTHKSTVGMKKMQEIAPKMKEIQAKFKDNPQRLQQETWALYRAEKVNPMSSCLPMLVQIPVFIALFNVLRSAVELRYAPFLWIADLSEPEGLLAAYLPFGGLNLLPILMAATTGLQSYFTPSTGDKSQQKMMMIFMPAMMLFMFYSFPSALSLYWFLSNIFSIVQMYLIRRATKKEQVKSGVLIPDEVIDPPVTRQMKRHG